MSDTPSSLIQSEAEASSSGAKASSSEAGASSSAHEASTRREASSQLSDQLAALTRPQQKVLQQLAMGSSIGIAATQAQVCRMTVYRWIKSDAPFRTAYNVWQRELLESAQSRLIGILDEAVDAIHDSIVLGNVEAAMDLVKSMGVLRRPRLGSCDAQQVARRMEVERLREDNETDRLETQAVLGTPPDVGVVASAVGRGMK